MSRSSMCMIARLRASPSTRMPCAGVLALQGVDLDAEALFFACEGLVANVSSADQQAAEIASGLGPGDADPLAASAWTLSSRPASPKKMWLDFQGGTITGKPNRTCHAADKHRLCSS